MKALFPLLCALLLFACNNATTRVSDDDADNTQPLVKVTTPSEATNANTTLDATLAAVQGYNGDVTALPGRTALGNIDTWLVDLNDVNGAEAVTWNLRALRNTLAQPNINGQLAGMQLLSLAEDTRKVAGGNSNLTALANALKAGGEKLTGTAFTGNDLLPQTLGVLKSKAADITTLPASAAVGNIDSWINTLGGMNGTSAITNDLKTLKMELQKPSIDGMKVGNLLKSLATKTRSVGGDNMGLATLAYTLDAGAARLMGSSK